MIGIIPPPANLQDVIEGNVTLALQLGLNIPHIEGWKLKKSIIPGLKPLKA